MSKGVRNIDAVNVFNANAMSATVRSTVIDCRGLSSIGIQIVFTGTPTGTFTIEGSNNYGVVGASAATWEPLTTSPATISAAGAGADHLISFASYPFSYLSVLYTRSSGTGVLDVYVTGKE